MLAWDEFELGSLGCRQFMMLDFMRLDLRLDISFIEDYAYLIQCLLDLSDATMNPRYRLSAKKYCDEALKKFYDNNNMSISDFIRGGLDNF